MKVIMGPYPSGKSKKKRKILIRIDKYDTWGCDNTISMILVPMLKQLKRTKHGIPVMMFENGELDYPEEYYAEKKNGPLHKKAIENEKKAEKKWNAVLDAMIWSFDQVAKDLPGEILLYRAFKKHNDQKRWRAESKAYGEKVQEGIDLFAKHFFNLWD